MSNSGLRVGIFLGYAPEQSIIDQGIGRLLGFLIEGVISQSTRTDAIAIACPAWYIPQVRELLADLRIPEDAVKLVTTNRIPHILRLRKLVLRARRRFFAQGNSATRQDDPGPPPGSDRTLTGLLARLPAVRKLSAYATSPLRELRRDAFAIRVYEAVRKRELLRLVQKINRDQAVDVWYSPTIFWPEFAEITGPKVVAVPDMVFVDFPLGYAATQFAAVFRKAQQLLKAETHLVCYSDYVRDAHLIDRLGVAPGRISVIRHGLVELQHYVPVAPAEERRRWAIQKVNDYVRTRYREQSMLAELDFSDVRFALYASQARPHKNLLQLVRTWEALVREHHCGVKLVLTCRLSDEPDVCDYVHARRLQSDILELNGLPAEILAALNVLATIAVNPSLFEGGFPFTFSEACSVGTPSVMSRIPAVLELVRDPQLRDAMLFDPYDGRSIVERVRWALANRSRLLEMQGPLYDELARRDWSVAASDYVSVFAKVAAGE